MIILHVYLQVKPERIEEFVAATRENARNSRREAGVVRFDVVQQIDDPTRFMLLEVYRDEAALEGHRQSPHYQVWVAKAPDMLIEPRTRQTYRDIDLAV